MNKLEQILNNISHYEDEEIINTISSIPLYSYISYIDSNNEYNSGGYLIKIGKSYVKIITNLNDFESIDKIKLKYIKKLYFVYNSRTYRRKYIQENKDKKRAQNRRYYLKKIMMKE
jgi:hypothetical protein